MKNSMKKNSNGDADADEYPGYARFVEEATLGYSAMQVSKSRQCFKAFVNSSSQPYRNDQHVLHHTTNKTVLSPWSIPNLSTR